MTYRMNEDDLDALRDEGGFAPEDDMVEAIERIVAREVAAAKAEALDEAANATLMFEYPTSADPDRWGAWLRERADAIREDADA